MATFNKSQQKELLDILMIETLEERKMDSLDFHELAVWTLKRALQRAYEMGRLEGRLEGTSGFQDLP